MIDVAKILLQILTVVDRGVVKHFMVLVVTASNVVAVAQSSLR